MSESMQQFPFGAQLKDVTQSDRAPKRVFVLGVYASAVHAKWVSPFGHVTALAVASEPYIFWRGDGAAEIIGGIEVPAGAGTLRPADEKFNGPSGLALDDDLLKPLGFTRGDAWLCDLVPRSCLNAGQAAALKRVYLPAMRELGLPAPSIPNVPKQLTDEARRREIIAELEQSEAEIVVLLGDKPLQWFLTPLTGGRTPRTLEQFCAAHTYGGRSEVELAGKKRLVMAVAHPRQTSRLGQSSAKWYARHEEWKARRNAPAV